MPEKFGPCIEKGCSWCCQPVKVDKILAESELPKDKEGKVIWKKRDEVLIPENDIEHGRARSYDCKHFDETTGKCKIYEDRPEICKNATCLDEKSEKSIDEQHRKVTEQKFMNSTPWQSHGVSGRVANREVSAPPTISLTPQSRAGIAPWGFRSCGIKL